MKQLIAFTIGFVLFSFLSISGAMSVELEYYGVESQINPDMTVHNTVIMIFLEPAGSLEYQLDFRIYNLKTKSNFPFAECANSENAVGSIISCQFTGMSDENSKLTIEYDTNEIISKNGETFRFGVDYGFDTTVERSFTTIKLPENSVLAEEVANRSFFPQTGHIASDGKRIMVYWEKEGSDITNNQQYSVLYELPSSRDPLFNYVIVILTFVILVTMIAIAIYLKRSPKGERDKHIDAISSVLNRDEKAILSILKSHDGKAGQKIIVRETNFSKAKVSRLVKNLRDRDVVETEPISGRENRVMLKDKTKEKADEKTEEQKTD